MPLIGQRVLLRALERRDLGPIWEAYQDFDLELETDGDAPPMSDTSVAEFWTQRIDHPAPEMRYFAVEVRAGEPEAGRFIGMCNLHDIDMRNRHAELGVWLMAPAVRGRGYGTDAIRTLLPYAFEVVRLERLYLGVYDFNEAGLRCYERVGFRYEGRLHHTIYYQGRYWDEWPMRILGDEWPALSRPPAEGLRRFHPGDWSAALALIRRVHGLADDDAARALLRRWLRRIDYDVLSVQREGALLGLFAQPADSAPDLASSEIAALDEARALVAGLRAPGG